MITIECMMKMQPATDIALNPTVRLIGTSA